MKEVLTKERTNKFIQKSRDYKLIYLFLLVQIRAVSGANGNDLQSHKYKCIEQIMNLFKQHRYTLDSDYTFIKNA